MSASHRYQLVCHIYECLLHAFTFLLLDEARQHVQLTGLFASNIFCCSSNIKYNHMLLCGQSGPSECSSSIPDSAYRDAWTGVAVRAPGGSMISRGKRYCDAIMGPSYPAFLVKPNTLNICPCKLYVVPSNLSPLVSTATSSPPSS